MRLFIVRLILITLLFLLFTYVIHWDLAIVWAFVVTWILEPLITSKI